MSSGLRYRATPDQEGLWAGQQRNPSWTAYHECIAFQISGALDEAALRQGVRSIVARHEPLRSVFRLHDGCVEQCVELSVEAELPVMEGAATGVHSWLAETMRRPFDLERGPLFRVGLYRVAAEERYFCVTVHHLVCDGWSRGVFLREFAEAYRAQLEGRPAQLPSLTYRYGDYAHEVRQAAADADQDSHRTYWRKVLADLPPPLPFEGDVTTRDRGEIFLHSFSRQCCGGLTAFAAARQVSPFVLCLALLQKVLYRETGYADVVIATDFAGRFHARLEPLIGYFARQLLVRLRLDPKATFAQNIEQVRVAVLEAIMHSDLPYADVACASGGDSKTGALFFVKMALEQNVTSRLVLGLTVTTRLEPRVLDAKFPLLLNLSLEGEEFTCRAEFDPRRISRETVTRIVSQLQTAGEKLSGEPLHPPAYAPLVPSSRPGASRFQRRRVSLSATTALEPYADPAVPIQIATFRVACAHADGVAVLGANRDSILGLVRERGAVLVRGLPPFTPPAFESAMAALFGKLIAYSERTSPRTKIGSGVYTSTDYPADQAIPLHNENSYASRWPRLIAFYCASPPEEGGITPVADCRAVWSAIPAKIRARFERAGVRYTRHFGGPLGFTTEEAFGIGDPSQLAAYLECRGYTVEYSDDGKLTTHRVCPATRPHPESGVPVWFNHAHFFHVDERSPGGVGLAKENLPTVVRFGDGSPIDGESIAAVRDAFARATVRFEWRLGDLLVLDNMAVAHGRQPYQGRRQIWVSMAEEICDLPKA